VTIYKKGNTSINKSISDYDEIISQFDYADFTRYDNATASGSQIIELLKSIKEEDAITVVVSNGYTVKNKQNPQNYTYESIYGENAVALAQISDKNNSGQYINPTAEFCSYVTYDDNKEITSVVFEQK